ncbi:Uncharacterised protein [Serratia quinivorans]|uniref:hypothetical protein n=1 Tax=Serratia quinivorans TaxID=137545 RepID=UPI000F6FB651|nr:hypothetical protein [Serratia quinivorans]VEI68086.1 Uncharacterised protein [Serratia quinivorans]
MKDSILLETLREFDDILKVLNEDEDLKPPFKVRENGDIVNDLKNRCVRYIKTIKELSSKARDNELLKEVNKRLVSIETLSDKITESLEHYLSGDIKSAYDTFDSAIVKTKIIEHLERLSVPLSELCSYNAPLYRVRRSDTPIKKTTDMFHIPFSERYKVKAQRYSVAGLPCLYLGTSIYVCWHEMGQPDFDKLYISSFITSPEESNTGILNLAYNLRSINRIKRLEVFLSDKTPEDYRLEKMSNLIVWPLVLACNYIKSREESNFSIEYIIPNLLMQWISRYKSDKISGIMYRSTKILNQRDSDIASNVIIPPKVISYSSAFEHCPKLASMFYITAPVSWTVFRTLNIKPRDNNEDFTSIKKGITNFDEALIDNYPATEFYKIQQNIKEIMKAESIEIIPKSKSGLPEL